MSGFQAKRLLGIPAGFSIASAIAISHPDVTVIDALKRAQRRKPLDEIVHRETFRDRRD
jgi:hypothetical protein